MPSDEQFHAIGRRKEASARVFLTPGGGGLTVNEDDLEDYFDRRSVIARARKALEFAEMEGEVGVLATVQGGGKAAQADALQLGIARALILFEPDLRKDLKDEGFLTRDDRVTERKKYGHRGARKKPQYSKR